MLVSDLTVNLYESEPEAQKAIIKALRNYWTPIKKEITPDNKIMITFKKIKQ